MSSSLAQLASSVSDAGRPLVDPEGSEERGGPIQVACPDVVVSSFVKVRKVGDPDPHRSRNRVIDGNSDRVV